jgi:hypothetical protein
MRTTTTFTSVICALLTTAGCVLATGCSSDAERKAAYQERQQIRAQGQGTAERSADAARSDLDRATAEPAPVSK